MYLKRIIIYNRVVPTCQKSLRKLVVTAETYKETHMLSRVLRNSPIHPVRLFLSLFVLKLTHFWEAARKVSLLDNPCLLCPFRYIR